MNSKSSSGVLVTIYDLEKQGRKILKFSRFSFLDKGNLENIVSTGNPEMMKGNGNASLTHYDKDNVKRLIIYRKNNYLVPQV